MNEVIHYSTYYYQFFLFQLTKGVLIKCFSAAFVLKQPYKDPLVHRKGCFNKVSPLPKQVSGLF